MKRIYESDYIDAVRKVHRDRITEKMVASIIVRTVEFYSHLSVSDQGTDSAAVTDVVTLNFEACIPDVINGRRAWKLQTEIILVPDRI